VKYNHAIVRKPGTTFKDGLTQGLLGEPDLSLTMEQHATYCRTLESVGLELTILENEEEFPDCPFVEDTAIVSENCAVITRPGNVTRRGETTTIEEALKGFRPIEKITEPGCVDGGDILRVENHFYIGISKRTNTEGANQLANFLFKYGHTASTVDVDNMLHLKTGINYIGENRLIMTSDFSVKEEFKDFEHVVINADEEYSVNCLVINGTMIRPSGYPKSKAVLEAMGFNIMEISMTEFQKMDGGLTCLSLPILN